MKILFDHQKFTQQQYGGITRYFCSLATELKLLKQDVKIVAPLYINEYLKKIPKEIIFGKYLNYRGPISKYISGIVSNLLTKYITSDQSPDIIHETYYSNTSIIKNKCPHVVTVYDMIHEIYNDSYFQNDPTAKLKINSINRADHVFCISENTRKDLINIYKIDPQKTSTVHLGYYTEESKSVPQNNPNSKPYVLYVGNRGQYKNFNLLLEAFNRKICLKNDFDIIAFGGGGISRLEINNITKFGNLNDKVKQVSGNDSLLSEYYKSASAFIFPSLYEGFGIPPLEAMAHGCPVISSNTSSMPEILGDAAEYFDPTSVESLINAMVNVLYSEDRRMHLINKGSSRVKRFSWEKCAANTLEVYKRLV